MRLLANENIPRATVDTLRDAGHDVLWVSSEFPSIKDEAVILFASVENRIIITFDRDYGELLFKRRLDKPLGVIYLRLGNFEPEEPAEILLNYLSLPTSVFEGRFSVTTRSNMRQRHL